MSDERMESRLVTLLATLKPKTKQPVSTKVLNGWGTEIDAARVREQEEIGQDLTTPLRDDELAWLDADAG
ncbi:MAG: hypothetical protein QM705_12430 [Ancrocorticia sp.]